MPAIGLAGEGVALLALVAAFLVCYGLLRVWSATIGWVFVSLADALLVVRIPLTHVHVFGPIAAFLKSVNKNVEHALGYAAMRCENAVAWLFHQTWTQLQWVAREIADLAHTVDGALGSVAITVVRPAVRVLDRKTVARLAALAATISRLSHTTLGRIDARLHRLEARVSKAVAATSGAIAHLPGRVGRVEKRVENQAHRLTKLERAAIGGAALAVTWTALKRVGLGWLKCDKVGRAGKAVCGMDGNLLESLLLDTALLTVAFNIETFARELQDVVGEAAEAIHDFAT